LADVGCAAECEALFESIAGCGACGAVLDHLSDFAGWAGVGNSGIIAGSRSIMILHETWVSDTVVCGRCSYATVAFLHGDGKDESSVHSGRRGH
jgi:hypothetical protein